MSQSALNFFKTSNFNYHKTEISSITEKTPYGFAEKTLQNINFLKLDFIIFIFPFQKLKEITKFQIDHVMETFISVWIFQLNVIIFEFTFTALQIIMKQIKQ